MKGLCVLGEMDEELAVGEAGDFVDVEGGFDLFVATTVVNGAGDYVCRVLFADLVFEPAPSASVRAGSCGMALLVKKVSGEAGRSALGVR